MKVITVQVSNLRGTFILLKDTLQLRSPIRWIILPEALQVTGLVFATPGLPITVKVERDIKVISEVVSSWKRTGMLTKTVIYFLPGSKSTLKVWKFRIQSLSSCARTLVRVCVCVCVCGPAFCEKCFEVRLRGWGDYYFACWKSLLSESSKSLPCIRASYIFNTGVFQMGKNMNNDIYYKTNMLLVVSF